MAARREPRSLAELADEAAATIRFSPRYSCRAWLRSCDALTDQARHERQKGDVEGEFLSWARCARCVLQLLSARLGLKRGVRSFDGLTTCPPPSSTQHSARAAADAPAVEGPDGRRQGPRPLGRSLFSPAISRRSRADQRRTPLLPLASSSKVTRALTSSAGSSPSSRTGTRPGALARRTGMSGRRARAPGRTQGAAAAGRPSRRRPLRSSPPPAAGRTTRRSRTRCDGCRSRRPRRRHGPATTAGRTTARCGPRRHRRRTTGPPPRRPRSRRTSRASRTTGRAPLTATRRPSRHRRRYRTLRSSTLGRAVATAAGTRPRHPRSPRRRRRTTFPRRAARSRPRPPGSPRRPAHRRRKQRRRRRRPRGQGCGQ